MHKIALLDDEYEFLDKIRNYFFKYENIIVDLYIDPYELIEKIDQYDAIFIDYNMPLMTAFDFFKITENRHYLKIVITNYDQVIFDSLKYDIFYFIRKKNLDTDFFISMEKLLVELEKTNNKLIVNSFNNIISVYYNDIRYIETDKNYIIIHTMKEYRIRCTFKKILSLINYENCIVISYGIIVNIEYIVHIDFKNMLVIMNDGLIFSISKKYKQNVRDKYREYRLL